MNDTQTPPSTIEQLRRVLKDAIDYASATLHLFQARFAEYTLTIVVSIILLLIAAFLAVAAFIFFNVALGMWLSHVLGNPAWSVLVLGLFYGLLSVVLSWRVLKWLQGLKS